MRTSLRHAGLNVRQLRLILGAGSGKMTMPVKKSAKLSASFQISIPRAIRTARGWQPGQEFVFIPQGEGILLMPVPKLNELAVSRAAPRRKGTATAPTALNAIRWIAGSVCAETKRGHAQGLPRSTHIRPTTRAGSFVSQRT
jgi:AbrB family looped-hinge helix DNA binding protein